MAKNMHNSKQRFMLWNHINANYVKSGESDRAFAAAATVELGFPVTEGNVYHGRSGLGIKANGTLHSAYKIGSLGDRVVKIERALEALYTQLGWLPPKE